MSRVKLLLRFGGISSLLIGFLCFPFARGSNDPVRASSIFSNLVDMGVFVKYGLILLAIGVVLLIAAWLMPGEEPN